MPGAIERSGSHDAKPMSEKAFRQVADRLKKDTGIVLSDAKKGLAVSRLAGRLRALGLPDFESYGALLAGPDGAAEVQEMILRLTTNVTRFFREPHHFETLKTSIFPDLVAKAREGGRVRIWSAGCSSGEEPYSIAMTLLDAFPQAASLDIRILATDIDRNMVVKGTAGRYQLSPEDLAEHPLLTKFTQPVSGAGNLYDVLPAAKSFVQFGELNLLEEWPMKGKFDVIFCRNVVIYFSNETQQLLWPRFAGALNDGGHLMIGHSERVTGTATATLRSSGVTHYQLNAGGRVQ